MDLLQGYGSDDESTSSVETGTGPEQLPVPSSLSSTPAPIPALAHYTKAAAPNIPKKNPIASSSSSSLLLSSTAKTKKGKRILKLNSVLPPDILERLTRSFVQSAGGRYESSSDDDGDDDDDDDESNVRSTIDNKKKGAVGMRTSASSNKKSPHEKKSRSFLKEKQKKNISGDLGLDSLLSDLQSAVPTVPTEESKKKGGGGGGKSNSEKNGDEKLGLAFMNVSNTVVRKKRNDKDVVVDVHVTTSRASKKRSNIEIEDLDSEEEMDEEEKVQIDSNIDVVPLFPSARTHEQQQQQQQFEQQKNNQSKYVSNSIKTNTSNPMKRPRNAVKAAPSIPSNFQTVKIPNDTMEAHQYTESAMAPPSKSSHHQCQTEHVTLQQPNQITQPTKMSKRELEKALRAGNFDSIDSSNITQNIDSSSYIQPSENELLATASTSNAAVSQYNTANLQMYVPSEGNSVATNQLSSQQKGKHQIHSLVANARKLEADRARLGAMGLGGRKSTRSDAKKKYGW